MPMWVWVIVGFLAVIVSACAGVLVLAAITNAPGLTGLLAILTPATPTPATGVPITTPSATSQLFVVATNTPTATGQAVLTPSATACPLGYSLQSVEPPSSSTLPIGGSFELTVTLANAGACAWPDGTRFTFEQGDALDAPATVDVEAIEPGQETAITIPIQAPQSAGSATQIWALRLPDDTPIGEPLEFEYNFTAATATNTRAPTRPATRPPAVTTPAPPPTQPPSSGGPIVVRRVNFVSAVRSGGNNANATLSIEFTGGTGPFTLTGDGILSPQVKNVTGTFENAGVVYSYILFERVTSCGAAIAGTVRMADSAGQNVLHLYNVNVVCQ
jgi:hypothetical protein